MPKKQPQDRAYSFKKNRDVLEDLELPNGGLIQARRPGVEGLIKAGIIDDLDTLTAIVATETIPTAEGTLPALPKNVSSKQVTDALAVMDKITVYCVVQPPLLAVPEEGEERDEDAFYVDDLDLDDKTFIIQFAMGGTRDLATFRAQSAGTVASVPAG